MTIQEHVSPAPVDYNEFVLGMPGEHGFYVPANLTEQIAAQHSAIAADSRPVTIDREATDTQTVSSEESVDLARQEVDKAFGDTSVGEKQTPQTETVAQNFASALEEIKQPFIGREPYSAKDADHEGPLTHYTKAGNIFQILRFGIQSNNFKNRVNALRPNDPTLDTVAPQMSGLRIKQGGSYQGVDSISLDQYKASPHIPPGNVSVLIRPNIRTYGAKPEQRDTGSGYGHGIVVKDIEAEFKVGNPTAYKTELLAANIVPPSDIRAILIPERTSILRGITDATRANAILYAQTKHQNPQTDKEDLLANCRLLASLSDSPELEKEIERLGSRVDSMQANEIARYINAFQMQLLQEFVGKDIDLTEEALRTAIQERFNIEFLTSKQ
ncbi:MAG TPA: hypothetical protein VIH90_01425 [Candidatus Saccharimonadales bacterium]